MKKSDLDEQYFVWLSRLVGVETDTRSYWELFRILYNEKFTWFIPNDDNREIEGGVLRSVFCEVMDIEFNPSLFKEDISVLETFIGIANRIERIMEDQEGGIRRDMEYWFWHMLTNIKLNGASDDINNDQDFYNYVSINIQKVLQRTYKRNGEGGLFPLRFDKKDQRKEEIWYQMSKYLVENYYGDTLKV